MIVKEENEHKNENNKKINKRKLKYYNSSKNIGVTSSFNSLLSKIKKTNTHKTLNEIMNEFSFYSIKEDKDEINKKNLEKLLDFNQLRKDFEAQKESNKIDLKIIKQKRLSILNKIKSEEEKNKKYRGKNVTKDHNGEIIFIKKIKLDKLKKEFFIPKTTSKFIKEEKKEIEINHDSTEESIQNVNSINGKILKKAKSKEVLKSIKQLPILKKPKSVLNIIFNEKYDAKEKLNENLFKNKDEEEIKKVDLKPFIPSGSCFNLINLEVGVSLKENNKYKSGGKDFFSKYKKYSISNFEKQLNDDLVLNSLKANTKYEYQNINDNIINSNSISNLKNKFNQENTNSYLDNISQKVKSNISTNNNSSSKINQHLGNKALTKSISSLDNNIPIIALTNGSTSLNDIFSSFDSTINLQNKKNLIKKRNIFRNNKIIKSLKNTFSLKDIDNFNKAILTNKNFEFNNKKSLSPSSDMRYPEKPLINEIYKEIGFKNSIYRNRNRLMLIKKPKALTTLEFFK